MRFPLFLRPLAVMATVTLLSGCVLAPGGHLDYRTESATLEALLDIEPITPELVASLQLSPSIAVPKPPELQAELAAWDYRIGAGDVLSIIVYDRPELTIPAGAERSAAEAGNEVRQDGTIFFPFIGLVEVAGKTTSEVRSFVAERLGDFLIDPQVDVRVAAFRSQRVHISGFVANPGSLPITNVPLTLVDAISQVGGAQENANWHDVVLLRDGVEQRLSLYALLRQGDQAQNRLLRDEDVLYVPSADNQAVAVMGEVRTPGSLRMGVDRFSLTDALARAGGLNNRRAAPSGVFVIRGQAPDSDKLATVYQLNVGDAAAFMVGGRFNLEPNDVVYVTAAPLARWNDVISLLLPSLDFPGDNVRARDNLEDLL